MTKKELLDMLAAPQFGIEGCTVTHEVSGLVRITIDFIGVDRNKDYLDPQLFIFD